MANANRLTPGSEPLIATRISPVIEREYKRRDIFPDLRLETAARIQNGATGVHMLSVKRAEELLADAQAMQAKYRELPRGIPAAYSALARNIGDALKQEARRGVWDDPGMEEVQKRAAQSSACFEVGDTVLYFKDDEDDGEVVTIADCYKVYCVKSDDGHYITDEGVRLNYKFGYALKRKGSDHIFFRPAHCVTREDCKPAHLRLVWSAA